MKNLIIGILVDTRLVFLARRIFGMLFSLINKRYSSRLDGIKYVHLMFNDKFNKPFVDFLNHHFDGRKHLILCKKWFDHPFPEGKNVIEVKSFRGFNFMRSEIKCIIFHSLFDDEMVDILYSNDELLSKSRWMIWGGDLYHAKRDLKNDYVRRNIGAYITDTDGDGEVAKKKYCEGKLVYKAGYTFPVTWRMVEVARMQKCSNSGGGSGGGLLRIQVNNSCDKSTLGMLNILSAYKEMPIEVCTIVSYGDLQYRKEILEIGKRIFGNRFLYVDKYMTPDLYAIWMSKVDILVLNQDRQQGLGNSFLALAMGAKLFIKSTVTTYSHFNERGIVCYDSLSIPRLDFKSFSEYPLEKREKNIERVKTFFSGADLAKLWEPIFR